MTGALAISDVAIRQDASGRFCLNDLHRAAGGATRHQPGKFFANKGTQALVDALQGGASPNLETPPVSTVNDGVHNGTFVVKELVYAYAMWISPEFSLRVIRAYDALVSAPSTPMVDLNDPAVLRGMLLGYTEKVEALQATVAAQAPKVEALNRFANHAGSEGLRVTAKLLGVPERQFLAWMADRRYIFRSSDGAPWQPYADRVIAGLLEEKAAKAGMTSAGDPRFMPQTRVTARGLAHIAERLAREGLLPPRPRAIVTLAPGHAREIRH